MVDNVSKPFTFTANTYAKANEVNADFDTLYTGLNACINQANTNATNISNVGSNKANKEGDSTQTFNVANPVNDANAVNLATLKAMYPVGSIYIGVMENCPLASLFGTWEKISEDRVLQSSSSDHPADTTIAAGLPNITSGQFYYEGGSIGDHGAIKATKTSNGSDGTGGAFSDLLQFDASWSNSIYGNSTTVQPPAYVVNVWRRTA